MSEIYSIYGQFLGYFPSGIQWLVSVVLAVLVIVAIFQVIKRNFIWIILLIILLPASVPILTNIWESAVEVVKYLLTRK
jgi:hypothetical protein